MAKMTRRAMLWATSAGVAAVAGVTAVITGEKLQSAKAASATTEVPQGSVTVYIASAKSGRLSIISGENEYVVNNSALVQEILNAAH